MTARRLIHRDDLPFEVIESIQKDFTRKVCFAGDSTNEKRRQKNVDILERIDAHFRECYAKGVCSLCGTKIPGKWPLESGTLPEGWLLFTSVIEDGTSPDLNCPACLKNQEAG